MPAGGGQQERVVLARAVVPRRLPIGDEDGEEAGGHDEHLGEVGQAVAADRVSDDAGSGVVGDEERDRERCSGEEAERGDGRAEVSPRPDGEEERDEQDDDRAAQRDEHRRERIPVDRGRVEAFHPAQSSR